MYQAIIQIYCIEADGMVVEERRRVEREETLSGGGVLKSIFVENWYRSS
jgi:hypothetical protein